MSVVVSIIGAWRFRLISRATPARGAQTPENGIVEARQKLRRMVLDSVPSPNSRRNYAKALDEALVQIGSVVAVRL
jgi:hypothetical protein